QIGNGGRGQDAERGELRVLCGIDVEADDAKADLAQAMRQRLTQETYADQPDGFVIRHADVAQGSGAMPRSRAAASRLSRNGFGIGMPCALRSRRLRSLCSPGSQMRSTPGRRSAPRMARIAPSTWRLNSAAGMKASTATATMAWPVLVALPGS